ncbi:o-succinylbenzoate synthase [Aetokthonos hydrillicola Thurmond2011]|jgi:O-succinylbenzoate synthase|uniref:o-succinylbenzoate synthase n=1 Tax=Aetokthonos hydrillicola Thurmond2011 TaxID=2712845 RepID=A0AAP5IEQ5_9CYAN|nr:o-succinylbenzoate synthase [Aetokthonos hydrillicola]MBO3460222.1 o-succinylbenzoate synthase [Aetokthonos hydrillicola CCALA 1050]MBW4586955.1 o-succinylbenzoate synthase [Aetokthonos hydrillicola CCALA 1050]MDR9897570.1 o-succinylbenzoate synthase [Aetokthonos hydrillicola Thurmond2011]
MKYSFEFRPYQRKFKQPLATSHGLWEVREGIIIRLTDKTGRVGFGEIAPLTWFGSESLEQALEFCAQLPLEITKDDVFAVPSHLPCCQFGLESAWEEVTYPLGRGSRVEYGHQMISYLQTSKLQPLESISFSGLLPSGKAALHEWRTLWNQGYCTFKWKIGIAPLADELEVFYELVKALPSDAKLRLDANGGLSFIEAVEWLKVCDGIEFLEQPLAVSEFDAMLDLSRQYSTKLALDESVANFQQLQVCYQRGWRGIFVIKPAIFGSPKLLRQFCGNHEIDAVFSTVFETPIGRRFGLKLTAELTKNDRAAGFGVAHWFAEDDLNNEDRNTPFTTTED